jgi:hypothetical protein
MSVYLVSEACQSTHGIYSATWGRYARVFIAASDGWTGPRDTPATADDIAAHFAEICNTRDFCIPENLKDEFVEIFALAEKSAKKKSAKPARRKAPARKSAKKATPKKKKTAKKK